MHIAQQNACRNTSPPAEPLEVFKARAWAVARLLENHLLADKATAVDGLWRYAEGAGLVAELGVDRVQAVLAEAFREC